MTATIDDSNNLIRWWREQLEGCEDWNSLPIATRKQLLVKLQRCVSALIHLHIDKEELLKLIQLTDIPTVFDALISMLALPDLERKNKYQALAYLTRVVLNSELGKLKSKPVWHTAPPSRKKKGKIATLDYAKKFDPYQMYRFCKECSSKIRIDNATGICSDCQKKGRNGQ